MIFPGGGRRLWRVVPGPEWEAAWAAASAQLSRPDAHMAAIQRGVARQPTGSFAFVDEDQRILRTVDPLDRLEIWVFFRVLREERTCELGWVHVRPISEDAGPT
jgi:hypothetical protein